MKWQYQKLTVSNTEAAKIMFMENLAEIGEMGWELVTIYNDTAYFKRPMPELPTKTSNEVLEGYFGGKVG